MFGDAIDINRAAELFLAESPMTRKMGVCYLLGLSDTLTEIDKVVQKRLIDRAVVLVKDQDIGKKFDGALVLLSLLNKAHEELTVRKDLDIMVKELLSSPDELLKTAGKELHREFRNIGGNRHPSSPSLS